MIRAGMEWTPEDEEQLRLAWVELVAKMKGRTEAAVRARLNRLSVANYHNDWPDRSLMVPRPTGSKWKRT